MRVRLSPQYTNCTCTHRTYNVYARLESDQKFTRSGTPLRVLRSPLLEKREREKEEMKRMKGEQIIRETTAGGVTRRKPVLDATIGNADYTRSPIQDIRSSEEPPREVKSRLYRYTALQLSEQ